MKKWMAALLAVFLLAGCGGEPAVESSQEESVAEISGTLPEESSEEVPLPEESSQEPEESSESSGEEELLPLRELVDISDKFLDKDATPYALRFVDGRTLAVEYNLGDDAGAALYSLDTGEAAQGNTGIVLPNSFDREEIMEDGRVAYISEDLTRMGVRDADGGNDRVLLDGLQMETPSTFWVLIARDGVAGVSGNTEEYAPTAYCVDLNTGETADLGVSCILIPQCVEGGRVLYIQDYVFSTPEDDCVYVYDAKEKRMTTIHTGSALGCTWAELSSGGDYVVALTEEDQEENIRTFAVFDAATGEKVNSALIRDLQAPGERSLYFALSPDGSTLAVSYYQYPGDYIHCGVALYRLD